MRSAATVAVSPDALIPWIPILPLLGALVFGAAGHRLPRGLVGFLACATVFASALLSSAVAFDLAQSPSDARIASTLYNWIDTGGLNLEFRFVVDRLSAVMILVVTWVGFLIHVYSWGYMHHDPGLGRYYAYLNLFMFAMLTLVLGDSLPLMFVGWEGVGLCSYLLIGFWYTDDAKAAAGKKAFVVNRIGDFGFILAMLLLFRSAGTLDIASLARATAAGQLGGVLATAACLLLFLGATGKSAQLPLYTWLPDAMAGPTPVSALIHAATMVTAGVYMVCRMGFLFSISPLAMATVACIGLATALFAATIATVQTDIKKVLAYSTVSQLGFMFIAAGVGAYAIAIFHVVTHAFFKACLFLGSGSVIHGMSGEQDMRQMGGLWRKQPITFATMLLSTMAITGFPLFSGFISKDAILWSAWAAGMEGGALPALGVALWIGATCAAGLTAFYMWRLLFMTFFSGGLRAEPHVAQHVHESPRSMTLPLMILAALSVVGGALGWPHLFAGHVWIGQWLQPVLGRLPWPEGNHVGLEWGLMAGSTGVALCGFALAYVLYARQVHPLTARLAGAQPGRWLYLRLRDKWHIDELYDAAVVQPLVGVSRVILYQVVDKRVIDAGVNFAGWLGRSLGFFGQLFQSGNIQRYLAVFAIALAVILYGWFGSGAAPGPEPLQLQAEAQP